MRTVVRKQNMIRILLFIFLVILFHQTKGQDKIEDLFQRAEEHFEKEELDSALLLYHFISENFKEHPSVPEAIYNKAYIFNRIDEKEKAKKIFIQFLKNHQEFYTYNYIILNKYLLFNHIYKYENYSY